MKLWFPEAARALLSGTSGSFCFFTPVLSNERFSMTDIDCKLSVLLAGGTHLAWACPIGYGTTFRAAADLEHYFTNVEPIVRLRMNEKAGNSVIPDVLAKLFASQKFMDVLSDPFSLVTLIVAGAWIEGFRREFYKACTARGLTPARVAWICELGYPGQSDLEAREAGQI